MLANAVLDRPNADPDDDLSILARWLLREASRVVPPPAAPALREVVEALPVLRVGGDVLLGDPPLLNREAVLLALEALPPPAARAIDADLQALAREIAKDWNGRVLDVWGAIDWIEGRANSDERTGIVIVDRDRAAQSLVAALAAPATPEPLHHAGGMPRHGETQVRCSYCGQPWPCGYA